MRLQNVLVLSLLLLTGWSVTPAFGQALTDSIITMQLRRDTLFVIHMTPEAIGQDFNAVWFTLAPAYLMGPDLWEKPHRHTMMLWRFSCDAKQYAIVESIDYDKDGKLVANIKGTNEWQYLVPGSYGEDFFKAGCEVIRARNNRK